MVTSRTYSNLLEKYNELLVSHGVLLEAAKNARFRLYGFGATVGGEGKALDIAIEEADKL